jgi:hypothetical protein
MTGSLPEESRRRHQNLEHLEHLENLENLDD